MRFSEAPDLSGSFFNGTHPRPFFRQTGLDEQSHDLRSVTRIIGKKKRCLGVWVFLQPRIPMSLKSATYCAPHVATVEGSQ